MLSHTNTLESVFQMIAHGTNIEYIKEKAWNRINIMRKLKFELNRQSLETIYLTFIRPVLEYANVVWDNCAHYEKEELEKIQNEAARIVTGTTKLVSLHALYEETGWDTLDSRRRKHKLTIFYFIRCTPTKHLHIYQH